MALVTTKPLGQPGECASHFQHPQYLVFPPQLRCIAPQYAVPPRQAGLQGLHPRWEQRSIPLVRTGCFRWRVENFAKWKPDLVLMDLTLPFFNGYYWCSEIRKVSDAPIIVISSAGDDMNLVMAINMGADDFLAKPFSMEVVVAKIQAVLRRSYAFVSEKSLCCVGNVTLDLTEAVLHYQDRELKLSGNEFGILKVLMKNPKRPVSREELMRSLWESENFIDDNTLTVNVTRLRKKLEEIGLCGFIEMISLVYLLKLFLRLFIVRIKVRMVFLTHLSECLFYFIIRSTL